MIELSIGDVVRPKTKAGLELSDVPLSGEYGQYLRKACVFHWTGVITDKKRCSIDYDEWDRREGREVTGLGTVEFVSYLIECTDGSGWAGGGSIVLADT